MPRPLNFDFDAISPSKNERKRARYSENKPRRTAPVDGAGRTVALYEVDDGLGVTGHSLSESVHYSRF